MRVTNTDYWHAFKPSLVAVVSNLFKHSPYFYRVLIMFCLTQYICSHSSGKSHFHIMAKAQSDRPFR